MINVLLVGCGKMGGALRARWAELADISLSTIEPNGGHYTALAGVSAHYVPDLILFAVKPQSLDELLPEYLARFGTRSLYVSIAAGKTLEYYADQLGKRARIIRAMPNTPAMVGAGMTVLVANEQASVADRALSERLFNAVGKTLWLEDEVTMHAVTALSGSGPAYVFLFMEALHDAGVQLGLSSEVATQLAIETVAGAGALARVDKDFVQLRQNVTSPGGTTEAALSLLMEGNALKNLLQQAMTQATVRSEALGGK